MSSISAKRSSSSLIMELLEREDRETEVENLFKQHVNKENYTLISKLHVNKKN